MQISFFCAEPFVIIENNTINMSEIFFIVLIRVLSVHFEELQWARIANPRYRAEPSTRLAVVFFANLVIFY